jgi:hypothetical protein
MDKAFRDIQQLKGGGMSTQTAFKQVFPDAAWKASTFSDNFRVWNSAPKAEMLRAISKGREAGGEWNKLAKKYGKRRAT